MLLGLGCCVLPRYIFFCAKLLGTQSCAYGSLLTALMHKPSVLKRSGTNAKERGPIHTASSHISYVLRRH